MQAEHDAVGVVDGHVGAVLEVDLVALDPAVGDLKTPIAIADGIADGESGVGPQAL